MSYPFPAATTTSFNSNEVAMQAGDGVMICWMSSSVPLDTNYTEADDDVDFDYDIDFSALDEQVEHGWKQLTV
eukprot:scaffold11853_cov163-Skeletonema_menzelii.AAC.2